MHYGYQKINPFIADGGSVTAQNWEKSCESFLAALVRHHSGGMEFEISDLHAIARNTPLLLVFDGLDEIADLPKRRLVIDEIVKSVNRLEGCSSSLQCIVTSRPVAFAEAPCFKEDQFTHIELGPISRHLIEEYADNWIRSRRLNSRDAGSVKRILKEKVDQPHLKELARNPMQLTILLSLIHTRGSSLPDKRTALYDSYVELFFSREAEKSTIVRDHRDLLIEIHGYLAWVLHSQAEMNDNRGTINSGKLKQLVSDYLSREGHDPNFATELFKGMVERVVALVSRVEGTFEFEVQHLREYFAARHLYSTAQYSPVGNEKKGTLPDRFDAIARNPYWLNVTRFYSGCYSKGELPSLVERIEEISNDEIFKYTSHAYQLAATLLSDWVFTQNPKSMQKIIALLLGDLGLRSLLTYERRIKRKDAPIILPKQCSNEQLVSLCVQLLKEYPQPDRAYSYLEMLRYNASKEDLRTYFLKDLRPNLNSPQSAYDKWLQYGLTLGVLNDLANEELLNTLKDIELTDVRVPTLLSAGLSSYFESDEDRFNKVIDSILDSRIRLYFRPSRQSLFDVFAHISNGAMLAHVAQDRQPVPMADLLNGRFVGNNSYLFFERDSIPNFKLARKLEDYIVNAIELLKLTGTEWATECTPWKSLIDDGIKRFGVRWTFIELANIAAGIQKKGNHDVEYDLVSNGENLLESITAARLKSGNVNWWKRQFDLYKNETDQMNIVLTCLTWSGPATLQKLIPQIDNVLSQLKPQLWDILYHSYIRANNSKLSRSPGTLVSILSGMPSQIHPRTVLSLIARCAQPASETLFNKYLANYDGYDNAILEYISGMALNKITEGTSDNEKHLAIIANAYSKGAELSRNYAFKIQRTSSPNNFSRLLARNLLNNANMYPISIVSHAEYICR